MMTARADEPVPGICAWCGRAADIHADGCCAECRRRADRTAGGPGRARCKWCGRPLRYAGRGRPPEYCGPRCKWAWEREKARRGRELAGTSLAAAAAGLNAMAADLESRGAMGAAMSRAIRESGRRDREQARLLMCQSLAMIARHRPDLTTSPTPEGFVGRLCDALDGLEPGLSARTIAHNREGRNGR